MKWRLAAGWVLAVVVTTAVAWQIVAVADEQVGDSPVSPIEAAPPSTTGDTTTTTISESTITAGASSSTTSTVDATATSDTAATSTSRAPGGGTSPTTSTTSTTSTSSSAAWSTKTATSSGGTVVVSYRPGEVRLETAVPLPGFQVEIDKAGPPEVDVEFESASLRVRIRAEWEDGSLEFDIDESSDDD